MVLRCNTRKFPIKTSCGYGIARTRNRQVHLLVCGELATVDCNNYQKSRFGIERCQVSALNVPNFGSRGIRKRQVEFIHSRGKYILENLKHFSYDAS